MHRTSGTKKIITISGTDLKEDVEVSLIDFGEEQKFYVFEGDILIAPEEEIETESKIDSG